MGKVKDLTRQRFGKLVVIERTEDYISPSGKHKIQWLCQCDCGNTCIVTSNALQRGNTKSCGCFKKDKITEFEDLTGKNFGKLVVIKYLYKTYNKKSKNYIFYYLCRCECGTEVVKSNRYLKYTKVPSCGCYRAEILIDNIKKISTKHGMKNTRIYRAWQSMKSRCVYKSVNGYKSYGGRGITVCNEWKNNFMNFYNWSIQNGYSDELTIDRINVNGNYCPENCRWVSMKEQYYNKRNTVYLTYKNKTQSLLDWCVELNLDYALIKRRLRNKNWTIERIFTEPKHEEKSHRRTR